MLKRAHVLGTAYVQVLSHKIISTFIASGFHVAEFEQREPDTHTSQSADGAGHVRTDSAPRPAFRPGPSMSNSTKLAIAVQHRGDVNPAITHSQNRVHRLQNEG